MLDSFFHLLAVLGVTGAIINFVRDYVKERTRRVTEIEKEIARRQTEFELEQLRTMINVNRVMIDKYSSSQFDVYIELWTALQGLRMTIDLLWSKVTQPNIERLIREMRTTEQKVRSWSLFFNDEHFQELERLFEIVESFQTGKLKLKQIKLERDLKYVRIGEIEKQVEENLQLRNDFEYLLDNLRRDFREKLSTFTGLDNI